MPENRAASLSLSLSSSLSLSLSRFFPRDAGSYPVTCPRRHGKCRSNSSTSARLIGQVCRHDVRIPFPSPPFPSFPRLASKFHGTRAIRAPPPPLGILIFENRPPPLLSLSILSARFLLLLRSLLLSRSHDREFELELRNDLYERRSCSKFLDNNSG